MFLLGPNTMVDYDVQILNFYTFTMSSDCGKFTVAVYCMQDSSYEVKIIKQPIVMKWDARKGQNDCNVTRSVHLEEYTLSINS